MKPGILIIIGAIAAAIYASAFTVAQPEYAIKFRLGKIVRTDFEPGLHWQVPIINNVKKFDRRILTLDADPERFLTSEKKDVIVDSFVKWRIIDVANFFTATSGDELIASQRLSQIIKDGLRGEFAKRTLRDVVSEEREQIMSALTVNANVQAASLGLEIVDVRIKRIDLPDEVSSSVYRRMQTERLRTANELRSEGREIAERIRAQADREIQVLIADAQRLAEEVRGEGDAKSAELYANAYSKDPEFYAFFRSLQAYRQTFMGGGDVLVLDPASEFFEYFGQRSAGGG